MTKYQKISVLLLRLGLGWLMLYAGVVKILDSSWSAAGDLNNAKTFGGFYEWFLSPGILPITNIINEWGLTLLGLSLILGLFVRWSGILGAVLMMLYYFPILDFPYPNAHSLIVDEHIIYALALLAVSSLRAGKVWGLDARFGRVSHM